MSSDDGSPLIVQAIILKTAKSSESTILLLMLTAD